MYQNVWFMLKMYQNEWFTHTKCSKMYDLSIKNIPKCMIYPSKIYQNVLFTLKKIPKCMIYT